MQLPFCHNFEAWNIVVKDFPEQGTFEEQLRFILGYALLAPSGHNAQPWQFRIGKQGIDVLATTPIVSLHDSKQRQFIIGIGCAIENLCIAADYFGFETTIDYLPGTTSSELIVAHVTLKRTRTCSSDSQHLIHMIPKRAMDRHGYEMTPVGGALIKDLQTTVKQAGQTLYVFTDPEERKRLVNMVLEATHVSLDSVAFREELASFLLPNLTVRKVGMTGSTLGVPLPLSWLLPTLMRKKNMATMTRAQDEKILGQQTPAFGVIATQANTPQDWLAAGRALERVALEATKQGFVIAIWAAAIEVGAAAQTLVSMIGGRGEPMVFFRLGQCAKKAPHSPRRTVADVIVSHENVSL